MRPQSSILFAAARIAHVCSLIEGGWMTSRMDEAPSIDEIDQDDVDAVSEGADLERPASDYVRHAATTALRTYTETSLRYGPMSTKRRLPRWP